jgi:UDP-glucose 4-epimerase
VFGDGEQTRDFCYVDNVVQANLRAAQAPRPLRGAVINVACGERTSLNRLLGYVAEVADVRLDPEHRAARAGDVRDSVADIDAARRTLGYEPAVDVRAGLRLTFEALARA